MCLKEQTAEQRHLADSPGKAFPRSESPLIFPYLESLAPAGEITTKGYLLNAHNFTLFKNFTITIHI